MADSSEEEMININRKVKPSKKHALEGLFEEEEENSYVEEDSTESMDYMEKNSLFFEIFGTGEEYKYVLEEKENITVEEEKSENGHFAIDVDNVYEYVSMNVKINAASLRKIVEMIGEGHSIHFTLLHNEIDDVGIEDGYRILDTFNEYEEFLALKEELKRQHGNDELLDKLTSVRSLSLYSNYRRCSTKKLMLSRELLSVEEFCDNLRMAQKLHEPDQSSQFLEYPDEMELVRRISLHPTFHDSLYMLYKENGTDDGKGGLKIDESVMLGRVIRLYQSDVPADDPWNRYREKIVLEAVDKVVTEQFTKKVLEEKRRDEIKKKVFVEVVDRIVNGSVGIRREGSHICGVTGDKRYIKAAMLDFEGNMVEVVTLKQEEEEKLLEFLGKYNPYCVAVSGFTTAIKYLMKTLSTWKPVFVENRIANMKAVDAHAFCCNIARLVQCPEIEYSSLLNAGIIYIQEPLSRNVLVETIRRGILTAISIVGIDINYLLNNKRKEGLISLIGMSETLKDSLFESGCISRLEDVKELCCNTIEFDNVTTYLRILPGIFSENISDVLDSTPIHPRNYTVARSICARLLNQDALDEKRFTELIREMLCSGKAAVENLNLRNLEKNIINTYVYNSLVCSSRPVYLGLPDQLVFRELTGSDENMVGKVLEGSVVKCESDFYLVSLNGTSATVYVRKVGPSHELFLNQLVTVRIDHVNDFLLSYTGTVVVQGQHKTKHSRFITHPLFKELDSKQAEEYLRENSLSMTLRRSGKDGSPIVVLRILDDVYLHMKVEESDKYFYKGHRYDDLDEFISRVAKKILINIGNIKKHKQYFDNESAVLEHLEQGGSYIRYGFYFSRKYPGKLCMLYRAGRDCKEYINVGECLRYEDREFKDLDEFVRYRKSI